MANIPNLVKAIGNNINTTIANVGGISDSALSITVANGSGLSTTGGYVIIDKGLSTEELVYIESVSGTTLTVATNGRAADGSTAYAHAQGASVQDVLTKSHINNLITAIALEHDDDGGHKQIDSAITASGTAATATNKVVDQKYLQAVPGQLINGKISVTVASNNITLAIKTLAGNDPSTSDPVEVRIGNSIRQITAALSVTVNAGTNSFAAGSTNFAAKEIDYFAYVGWRAASSAVVLGFSRIPYAGLYSDFNATATNEKYGVFSTTPASSDEVEVCGRFAATLSAGAGYTWTVPTYTNKNLIAIPIYETRELSYLPTYGANGSMTYTASNVAYYRIVNGECFVRVNATGTIGGTPSNELNFTPPMSSGATSAGNTYCGPVNVGQGSYVTGNMFYNSTVFGAYRYDRGNHSAGANGYLIGQVVYALA